MDDPIVIFAIVFALLGVIAVFVAMFVMMRKQKQFRNSPVIKTKAKIMRLYSDTKVVNKNFSSETVDSYNGYRTTQYFAEFKPVKGNKLIFKMKKKAWLALHENESGHLVYQAHKLISFEPKKEEFFEDEAYFNRRTKSHKTFQFYGESKFLNVSIDSKERINVSINDIERWLRDLKDDTSDWFFVIKRDDIGEVQFEKEGLEHVKITHLSSNEVLSDDLKNIYAYINSLIGEKK